MQRSPSIRLPFSRVRASMCTLATTLGGQRVERALAGFRYGEQPSVDDDGPSVIEVVTHQLSDPRACRAEKPCREWTRAIDRVAQRRRVALLWIHRTISRAN